MSRPWRIAVGAAQLVFAVALVAGLYLDLMMLAPRLPELGLSAAALSRLEPNAREDRVPTTSSAARPPAVETPSPPGPPPPGPPAPPPVTPPVTAVARRTPVESASEVPGATPETAAMAAPIETISSLSFVEVSPVRERKGPTPASQNVHALAAHADHGSAPPPRGKRARD